jgi:carbamate kinase
MRVVVALGGNALLKRGEPMTAEVQRGNVKTAAQSLAPVAQKHQLVLSHGNGPQVGLLALQGAAYEEVDTYPLDVLGAQTEGMIGYMIEQELGNLLPFEVPFATILTMVEVDPDDNSSVRYTVRLKQWNWPLKRAGQLNLMANTGGEWCPPHYRNGSSKSSP